MGNLKIAPAADRFVDPVQKRHGFCKGGRVYVRSHMFPYNSLFYNLTIPTLLSEKASYIKQTSNLIMKNAIIYLFIILGFSCKNRPEDYIIDECVGASFYYLDNKTDQNFLVEFVSPNLNYQIDSTTIINVKQRVLIGQDAMFGAIPRPSNTFSNFAVYKLVNGKRSYIYRQNPLQDVLWVKKKQNPNDPDYGCQSVDYTLTITNDMLQ